MGSQPVLQEILNSTKSEKAGIDVRSIQRAPTDEIFTQSCEAIQRIVKYENDCFQPQNQVHP